MWQATHDAPARAGRVAVVRGHVEGRSGDGTARRRRCPRPSASGCAGRDSPSRSRRPHASCSGGTSRSCRPRPASARRRGTALRRATPAGTTSGTAGRARARRIARIAGHGTAHRSPLPRADCRAPGFDCAMPAGHLHRPLDVASLAQRHGQPHRRAALERPRRAPVARVVRPRHVRRRRAVARLARHVHLRPRRLVGVGGAIVALAQVRRVARRALRVPVLAELRPVQDVGVRDLLVRIQVVPALPARRPSGGCPRRCSAPGTGRPETRSGTAAAGRRRRRTPPRSRASVRPGRRCARRTCRRAC